MCRSTPSEILALFFLSVIFLPTVCANGTMKEINKFFESYNVGRYNKCGFHIVAHYFGLPDADMNVKKILQERPANDTSVVSPTGKFRIHYDTSGVNQPFLYDSLGQKVPESTHAIVDSVAKICDYVYAIEVDSLGYPPPPQDSGAGGGNEYDIYVQNLPTGEYGVTFPDYSRPIVNRTNATYPAWTVIRNEYESTYTRGIPAIEVTIAHEFHHGIQIGNYGLWQGDLYFYELTSTWMEQVVYPEVKDYYQYLPNFFDNVNQPFNFYDAYSYAGYERCVFGIFVQSEIGYGSQVMKSIWNNMAHEPSIPAIEDAFKVLGVDASDVFQSFAQWNYFTGYRTQLTRQYNVSTYPDAVNYPLVKISEEGNLSGSGVDFSGNALRLTEHFYEIADGPDTIGIGVINNNFAAAEDRDTTSYSFSVGISNGGSNCFRELSGGYCLFFTGGHDNWRLTSFVLGEALVAKNDVVFPQPYDPRSEQLRIPYPFSDINSASLSILSPSGNLVNKLIGDNNVAYYLRGRYFVWNGRDKNGNTVSSGVYIYVLTDGSKSVVGKIAVVRN